ncbi:MAG: hypothetical protein N3B13_04930, partial [Deltaproteobacteria bacterium]|nr:hypothetical protein [Deltaproteobacteria bacterium]
GDYMSDEQDRKESDLSDIQKSYYDRPFLKFIKSEGWIFIVALAIVASFVIYKKYFMKTDILTEENIPKYIRVLNDFDALIEDFENEINLKREEKKRDGKARIDITPYKTRLYQIYDFMYVQKIAPESPFYRDYSKEEKDIILRLMNAGKKLDKIVIEIYNFNGDPLTVTDFMTIKRILAETRDKINQISGK